MLRIVSITSLLLLGAYASSFDESENFIDFRDGPINGYALPYAYQAHKGATVTVKKVSPYLDDGRHLVPAGLEHDLEEDSKSVFDTSVVSIQSIVGAVQKVIVYLFHKVPALIIGTLVALGVCNFTPLCGNLSAYESLIEIKREIRSIASSERVAEATEFVQNAIRKYTSLQDPEQI